MSVILPGVGQGNAGPGILQTARGKKGGEGVGGKKEEGYPRVRQGES